MPETEEVSPQEALNRVTEAIKTLDRRLADVEKGWRIVGLGVHEDALKALAARADASENEIKTLYRILPTHSREE